MIFNHLLGVILIEPSSAIISQAENPLIPVKGTVELMLVPFYDINLVWTIVVPRIQNIRGLPTLQ